MTQKFQNDFTLVIDNKVLMIYISEKEVNNRIANIRHLPDLFCNFILVKNHKIAKNSTTTKARAKISPDLESLTL